ncbi:MAG: [protein-PII] uridylyltransferase [Burkholderiales bacterium]|nr:[protein-PII] uridylyltransferase [Burkholderiales bacterium]
MAPAGVADDTSAASPAGLAEIRARYRDGKTALLERFATARPTARAALTLLRALAGQVDETLLGLWQRSGMPAGTSLVAVGGYGRGELFPHSDVDVLVILPVDGTDGLDRMRRATERFITDCWDAGLEIGSSVRTVDECVAMALSDVTVQTALLEARFLGGDRKVFTAFQKAAAKAMDAKAFLRAKSLELNQRHQKYENTPYSLEPNCKESPGGLRDLQTVIWVARAAGLGRTWQQLAAHGLITPFEVRQLQRNEGVLKLIRARLHMIAGRREDRLVFDLQTAVAESFGYKSAHGQRASERLMRRYYWAAKAVTQLNQILMLNIEERVNGLQDAPMRPINDKFLEKGGMLEVASDDLYQRDPHAILETFLVYQQTVGPKGLSARTLRALYNARNLMDGKFRRDPVNHATFMKMLRADAGQTHAFRLMNETSVLGRYLWVFRRIVGQMQHDLFHVYTVDQHILMVLRNVRRFFIPEHAHEYPFCSQLASTFDRPWVLFIAALFHDVAKGRGGDHSVLGEREARRFCRDHGVEREDTQLIEFLVGQHLTMSRIAQKEDLSDPDVIAAFAKAIGNERRLTALYLLTVADIRGTSPKVWNAWKGKLLEDLYRLTLRALGGARPNLDAEIEATKLEARLLLNLASLPGTVEVPLWRTLELSYFARHEAGEIAWHTRSLIDLVDSPTPVVRARVSPFGEGLQVLVYAPDRQDLFARTCGYFDGANFNILDAKVHTTTTSYALDTFLVVSAHFDSHYRDLIAYVETQLTLALNSTGPLPEPSRGRISRRVRSFPVTPRVTLRPDERAQHWLLGVSASDRSGLLYAISRVLANHNINLQLAKITTLGERVEDTFLIDGSALQQNKLQLQIETEMLDAISA